VGDWHPTLVSYVAIVVTHERLQLLLPFWQPMGYLDCCSLWDGISPSLEARWATSTIVIEWDSMPHQWRGSFLLFLERARRE
jgi:hypothetical protein